MNTPRILQILCLALAFSFQPSAFPQVQWTATTDTNGNFTWPVQIPSGQVGAFTNDLLLKTTNGIITGHCYSAGGYWLQAGQFITVCSSSGFSVADTNGGFAYTNGIFYVDGVPAANTLQLGSNYLSLSNYTTMQFGTLGTNGTNFTLFVGLGSTNLAYRIGAAATNNTLAVSNLAYVLGANGTNYANQVNAAAQSFAIGLAANATNNLNGASNVLAVVIGAGLAAGTNNLNTASNNLAAVIAAGLAAGTNNLDSASNVLSLLVAGGGLSYLIGNNILLRTPDT